MRRKSFAQLFMPALGYMIMGNLLATIMTLSLASFAQVRAIMGVAAVFAAVIYLSLVFTPAYKDGVRERALLHNKRVETVPKYRWAVIGLILWAIMLIPFVLLLTGVMNVGVYRLVNGAVYPLSLLLSGSDRELFAFAPFVFAGFYGLTAVSCWLGFYLGVNDKLSMDKIVYK
ncbi:MAG: hypothetical protein LBI38_00410 [Oscillospiraceae bacterium]|jgi:hypothetical protein|nr:hypothetical protein [Oscillospiraceae bacterium]